ncbi:hypothetical protein [Dethiothermospora halolimnae]
MRKKTKIRKSILEKSQCNNCVWLNRVDEKHVLCPFNNCIKKWLGK